ncbi:MAG: DUF2249 domain-containing protein [Verrucomicrobia bacterium]|nr:DUF2249 domain-containing protein [Verrucomicrobiota bacterium]
MNKNLLRLDVRSDIRNGQEPFSRIMQAVAALKENEELLLIAPFEPVPLFGVLATRGFAHESKELSDGDWEVRFHRGQGPAIAPATKVRSCGKAEVKDVDARGLEPPQPLVAILEAVSALPPGAEIKAHTDRRPLHLYQQLIDRGYSGQTDELSDGSFLTHIRPLRRSL